MPFVNTISFSHRFSDDAVMSDCCSYQEINHIYSADSATAIARAYVQFMLACGYAPSSVLDGMEAVASEYSEAWLSNNHQYNKCSAEQ
jgi:beta-glucosidase-like glycosyl hydrolase